MNASVKFGLIFAFTSILWSLLEIALANQFGFFQLSTVTSILAFLIPLTILTIALRKEKLAKPVFHLSDAIKPGSLISLIGATGFSLYTFLLYTLYPQVISPYLTYLEEQLTILNSSPEEITAAIEQVQNQFSATNQALFTFVLTLSIGMIISYALGRLWRTKFSHTEISATPE